MRLAHLIFTSLELRSKAHYALRFGFWHSAQWQQSSDLRLTVGLQLIAPLLGQLVHHPGRGVVIVHRREVLLERRDQPHQPLVLLFETRLPCQAHFELTSQACEVELQFRHLGRHPVLVTSSNKDSVANMQQRKVYESEHPKLSHSVEFKQKERSAQSDC